MAGVDRDWVVLKFGGTSVSTRERWETIARIVRQRIEEGLKPFVVCSALSGISNMLEKLLVEAVRNAHEPVLAGIKERHIELAAALKVDAGKLLSDDFVALSRMALGTSLTGEVSPRLHARVMAMGEIMATKLGAAFLVQEGLAAEWLDAREMLSALEEPEAPEVRRYLSANCLFDPDGDLQERLNSSGAQVFLTQGFIAANNAGETVLLGRGGSDTSAAYFAAKIQAQRLEIWTDVPGMFTANPHQIPSARLLRQLGYNEAQELATMGAKVLHPRCLDPVRKYHIPLHICCTQRPELEGTVITDDIPDSGAQVKAISAKTGLTLITMDTLGMWQQVGFLADVFSVFKRNGLSVDLIATSETNLTVTLDPMTNALKPGVVKALLRDLNAYCKASEITPCAVVSLVGRRLRSILSELTPALEVFEEHQIYLVSQAASDLNLSFVVDEEQADRLVRELHAQLFGDRQPDQLFGSTWRELSEENRETAAGSLPVWWRDRRAALLEIAARHTPVFVYDEETLNACVADLASIDAVDKVFYAVKANPNAEILQVFHDAGLSFECVSPGELNHLRSLFPDLSPDRLLFTPNFAPREEYSAAFEMGVHVTLDNLFPLEAWPEVFRNQEIIVRVDPGQGHGHHKYVRTAGSRSKFGVTAAELERLVTLADVAGARIVGLHAHVGSGIRTPETWFNTAVFLASLANEMEDVRLLNVGGGLGISERPGVPVLDVNVVAETLAKVKAAHPQYQLWMEPGRYLVANAGVLLARVTQIKDKGVVQYVGVDTGMNSLIRPALYGSYHQIVNLSRLDETPAITAEGVGPICESGDILGHGRPLPQTTSGDVMLVATAGAYGRAMSSNYNLREPGLEVMLRAETANIYSGARTSDGV